jgi:hypothetical protein
VPEWSLILVAVIGIIFIGLFFTALSLVKNFARLLFLGILGFLLLVLMGRGCAAALTRTDPTLPPPGREEPFPPRATDREFNLPESLRDLGRRIDNFVFGTDDPIGQQPPGTTTVPDPRPRRPIGQQDDLIYQLPEGYPDPITGQATRAVQTQPSGTTGDRRPVSGLW